MRGSVPWPWAPPPAEFTRQMAVLTTSKTTTLFQNLLRPIVQAVPSRVEAQRNTVAVEQNEGAAGFCPLVRGRLRRVPNPPDLQYRSLRQRTSQGSQDAAAHVFVAEYKRRGRIIYKLLEFYAILLTVYSVFRIPPAFMGPALRVRL